MADDDASRASTTRGSPQKSQMSPDAEAKLNQDLAKRNKKAERASRYSAAAQRIHVALQSPAAGPPG
eukprot:7223720-Prymnesium_polylepis.1